MKTMDKKSFLSFLCIVLILPTVHAQDLKRLLNDYSNGGQVSVDTTHNFPNTTDGAKCPVIPDTIYCTSMKKQHGWFMPLDIISKDNAQHVANVIRFTIPDKNGHYCKMETLDAYGRYCGGLYKPYVYDGSNLEWEERLEATCIYEMVSDIQGRVVQELAYDSNYDLVYAYSRTPIGKDSLGHEQYIGTYRDGLGLPAEMRNDTLDYDYGTLVLLTEDCWGNVAVIEFLDGRGRAKLNNDGVYMQRIIYDKDGREMRFGSCNIDGSWCLDDCGNCGYIFGYDAKGYKAYSICVDASGCVMPMPDVKAGERLGVIRSDYKYDDYGRIIEEAYTDSAGTKAMTNNFGVHRCVYKYDDHGNQIAYMTYDTIGNLTNNAYNFAVNRVVYDNHGRVIDRCWNDEYDLPLSESDGVCRIYYEYDEEGNQILKEDYCITDGREVLSYKYTKNDSIETTKWRNGDYHIVNRDKQGREICEINYSTYRWNYCWKRETEYHDLGGGRCVKFIRYFDGDGNPDRDGTFKIVEEFDSLKLCSLYKTYDSDENLTSICRRLYDRDFNYILGQQDVNAFGVACRSGGNSGTRYYNADVYYTPKGDFGALVGRDEFGEPDYIDINGDYNDIYYYTKETKTGRVSYDEDDKRISRYDNAWLPKVPSVEVIDSIGYILKLKDNDIILSYGDYTADPQTRYMTLEEYKSKWTIGSVLNAEREKRVVVFRINPDTKEYNLEELTLPPGTPSQLGFVTHVRYLTRRQMERIKESVEASPLLSSDDLDRGNTYYGVNTIVAAYPELRLSKRKKLRDKQMMDPAVLVGSCIPDYGLTWTANNSTLNVIEEIFANRGDDEENSPEGHFFFTKNLRQTCDFSFKGNNRVGLHVIDIAVNDSVYANLCEVVSRLKANMDSLNVNTLNRKTLYGLWHASETVAQSDYDEDYLGSPYTCEVDLRLEKDGRFLLDYNMQINPYCYFDCWFSDGEWAYADFDVQGEYAGNWRVGGRSIVLEYTDTIYQNFRLLSAYDGNGNPSADVNEVRTCLNGFAKDKDKLIDKTLPKAMLAKYIPLRLCTKDSFVVNRTDSPNPVFHKVKASKRKKGSSRTTELSSVYNGLVGTWCFPIRNTYSWGSTIVNLKSDHALRLSSSYHYSNGDLAFNCTMQVDGQWEQKGPRLTFSYPDSLIEYTIENIECSYAADDASVKEFLLSKKQVLRNIAFDTDETYFDTFVHSLVGDTLVIAGEGFTGILTRREDDAQAIAYIIPNSPERLSTSGTLNGHEYVDLGLSVKWSSCYLGAKSPTDYGDYYQWGALVPKTSLRDTTPANGFDVVDIAGDPSYDAARDQWGDTWHMPTQAEMVELESSCLWIWTALDHVQGYVVIGPNGNSIFLSAAGLYMYSSPDYVGRSCSIWSSTPVETGDNKKTAPYILKDNQIVAADDEHLPKAYKLHFWKDGQKMQSDVRDSGYMIRPVCP